MTTIIATAVYNYLQTERYYIDYEYCGSGSKDDQAIANMIALKELSLEDVTKVVKESYYDRLRDMSTPVTIASMTKALSVDLCGIWIAKQDNITWGYNWSNKYFDGLRAGDDTVFIIA